MTHATWIPREGCLLCMPLGLTAIPVVYRPGGLHALSDRPQHDMTPDHQHPVALRVCVSLRPPRSTNRPFDRVLHLLLHPGLFSSPRPVHSARFDLACHPARRAHHPTRLARLSFHSPSTPLVIDRSLTLSRLPAPHSSVLARSLSSVLYSSVVCRRLPPCSTSLCLLLPNPLLLRSLSQDQYRPQPQTILATPKSDDVTQPL
jgi:hypothetical protein